MINTEPEGSATCPVGLIIMMARAQSAITNNVHDVMMNRFTQLDAQGDRRAVEGRQASSTAKRWRRSGSAAYRRLRKAAGFTHVGRLLRTYGLAAYRRLPTPSPLYEINLQPCRYHHYALEVTPQSHVRCGVCPHPSISTALGAASLTGPQPIAERRHRPALVATDSSKFALFFPAGLRHRLRVQVQLPAHVLHLKLGCEEGNVA